MALVFCLATLVAIHLYTAIYVGIQAVVGWRVGATVETVRCGTNIFFGPFAVTKGRTSFEAGWLPLLGHTRFYGSQDEAVEEQRILVGEASSSPVRFQDLHVLRRFAIVLSGPASTIFLGLALLSIPIFDSWPQVTAGQPGKHLITPSSVPDLGIATTECSILGQSLLVDDTIVEFWCQPILGKAEKGWGGVFSWIYTCGHVGKASPQAWVSCVALIFLANGLFNLVPIPSLNGGHILFLTWEACFGRVRENIEIRLTLAGVLFAMGIALYFVWLDLYWFLAAMDLFIATPSV